MSWNKKQLNFILLLKLKRNIIYYKSTIVFTDDKHSETLGSEEMNILSPQLHISRKENCESLVTFMKLKLKSIFFNFSQTFIQQLLGTRHCTQCWVQSWRYDSSTIKVLSNNWCRIPWRPQYSGILRPGKLIVLWLMTFLYD